MATKKFWGPWTIYRRRDDVWRWQRFELACSARGIKPSAALMEAADNWTREHAPKP